MTEGFSQQIETSKALHSTTDTRCACRSEMSERICMRANGARAVRFIYRTHCETRKRRTKFALRRLFFLNSHTFRTRRLASSFKGRWLAVGETVGFLLASAGFYRCVIVSTEAVVLNFAAFVIIVSFRLRALARTEKSYPYFGSLA